MMTASFCPDILYKRELLAHRTTADSRAAKQTDTAAKLSGPWPSHRTAAGLSFCLQDEGWKSQGELPSTQMALGTGPGRLAFYISVSCCFLAN